MAKRTQRTSVTRRKASMSIWLWILIIILVLAVLGFFGRGRFTR
jgi:predicted nucleic acid-binding Zn ribbon protein